VYFRINASTGLASLWGITFGDPVEGDLSTQTFSLLRRLWFSSLAQQTGCGTGITFGDPVEGDLSTQTFSLLRRLWFSSLAQQAGCGTGITFGDPVEGDLSTQTFSLLRRLCRFIVFHPSLMWPWLGLKNKNLHRIAVKV
jgi:hypothetical protein